MRFATLAAILAAVLPAAARAATSETILHSFQGGADGTAPHAGLVADASGALYGTTAGGGGTVFKLAPPAAGQSAWSETVLHSFGSGKDGSKPYGGLIIATGPLLYGTACQGGATGNGIAFELKPPASGSLWVETILHDFAGGSDGACPMAGLLAAKGGVLYGTTRSGGGSAGLGTVFTLTPPTAAGKPWTEAVIYRFPAGGSDGANPVDGLIADPAGALYGTTLNGGSGGYGTVFKLIQASSVWSEAVLYRFRHNGADGNNPWGGLLRDAAGRLYGTTENGGTGNIGAIFQLTPPAAGKSAWTEAVLHSFAWSDGAFPLAGLIADSYGTLYGTTDGVGSISGGTVFALAPPILGKRTLSVLYRFSTSGRAGVAPAAGLIADAAGNLYGTTTRGGTSASGTGTVFKLAP